MSLNSLFADLQTLKCKRRNSTKNEMHKISSNQLAYYSKLVEYELIKEVILDLAYEYELNLLTCRESDAYCTIARIWTECHVSKDVKEAFFYNKEKEKTQVMDDVVSLLHTRMEEKLNERLALFNEHNQDQSQYNSFAVVEKLQERKAELDMEFRRLQATYADIVSRIYTISFRLFREYRHEVRPRMSRQALAVLTEQGKALLLRITNLQKSVEYSASQPSETLDILKKIQSELSSSRRVLQSEVEELEKLLATYENKDGEYHNIVKQYTECQRQLSLRSALLHDTDVVHRNQSLHKKLSNRRSLSTGEYIFHASSLLQMDELTKAEQLRIEQNRKRALELKLSQVVANDRHDVYVSIPQSKINTKNLSDGGFILEEEISTHQYPYTEKDEESSDPELNASVKHKRRKRRFIKPPDAESNLFASKSDVPIPPDQEKPICDICHKLFEESFLRKTFEVDVCDRCRDPKNIHALITKSTAKERYLLNDIDLDIREPKLNYLLKRNPHNSSWGDMRLYLEAQIAERALEIWGSEDALEEERVRRLKRNEESKLKSYNKKVKGNF
ncbi:DNA repair protein complementing XP-A cells like [Schistosoma japonicum]|nr:DNA repair protein complementing XP-A cells like [Schistosoma japonicum]